MAFRPQAYGRLNPPKPGAPLTKRERVVYDTLKMIEDVEKRPATSRELAARIGISAQAVLEHLRRMAVKGHIKAVPHGSCHRYTIAGIERTELERIAGDGDA